MRRFTSMKVGLASILSCLALFLGLFATTGTASAYTAAPTTSKVDPHIRIAFVFNRRNDCTSFLLVGRGFSPDHQVRLHAEGSNGFGVNINPHRTFANDRGNISTDVTVCSSVGRFENCPEFIGNPNFFCGFNLNPNDFCRFGFESGQFCSPGVGAFPRPFPGCRPFECEFHPVRTVDFCRLRFSGFCNFFLRRSLTAFVTAEDLHTGEFSNTVAVRISRFF